LPPVTALPARSMMPQISSVTRSSRWPAAADRDHGDTPGYGSTAAAATPSTRPTRPSPTNSASRCTYGPEATTPATGRRTTATTCISMPPRSPAAAAEHETHHHLAARAFRETPRESGAR
jgi:hypothetical protein